MALSKTHQKILAASATGGVLFLGLFAVNRRQPSPPRASHEELPAPGANPAADQAHEAKALAVELKKKPDHTPILFRMAQLEREMGKPAEAANHLRQILTREPANQEARLELGRVLYETGDVQGAIEETNRLLTQNPKHVDALYNMGAIYGNLQKNELARQYWERAVASDPASESGRRAKDSLLRLTPPR